jgi:hypothetical protein
MASLDVIRAQRIDDDEHYVWRRRTASTATGDDGGPDADARERQDAWSREQSIRWLGLRHRVELLGERVPVVKSIGASIGVSWRT